MRKLKSWFDGKTNYNDEHGSRLFHENILKDEKNCSKVEACLPYRSLNSNLQKQHERHLHVKNLNKEEADQYKVNTDLDFNICPKNVPNPHESQILMDLEPLDMTGGRRLKAANIKKGGGASAKTPIKNPRKNVAKTLPKPKPQTPEFKRILERIKSKNKEKANSNMKLDGKGKKTGQNSDNKTTNTEAEMQPLVDEKLKGRPPLKPPLPKIGVGGGRKIRGGKLERVDDRSQRKIDDLWNVKLKVREKEAL